MYMRNTFCSKLKMLYNSSSYDVDRLEDSVIYVYDCQESKRTFITTSSDNAVKSLKLVNDNNYEIVHICVDGGLIEYGLEDYVGDGVVRGRCDCMLFNDNKLLLVEFKMNVNPTSEDSNLWRHYRHAMAQIRDFFLYLRSSFERGNDDLHRYYSVDNITPIICMKVTPNIHPRRNAQRNNEKERFRLATNLKIQSMCEYTF